MKCWRMCPFVVRCSTLWTTVGYMQTPPHMTVAEFGVRMAMPEWMVRKRIRKGDIRAVNIGHANKPEYRISEAELTRYVTANATEAA